MKNTRTRIVIWSALLLLTTTLLSVTMGGFAIVSSEPSPALEEFIKDIQTGEGKLAFRKMNLDYREVDTVLAERERQSFFLTPALLVQEAISDEVVLTYPEE